MQDRRKHLRATVNWGAEIKVANQGIVPARIRNISMKGTYIESASELPIGLKALVKIQARVGERLVPILIEGAIARRTVLANMRGYGYGLLITRISDEDQKLLRAFCNATPRKTEPNPAPTDSSRQEPLVDLVEESVNLSEPTG